MKILDQWLSVDPLNPSARLYEAQWDFRHGQAELADDRLAKLLEDHPDDPDVLANVENIYSQLGRTEVFLSKLEDLRQRQPDNLTLVEAMIAALQGNHPSQAARVLDQTRQAIGADPGLLYQLALLYHEIGHDQVYQQLLAEVLKADATNAPANNDLGYSWADAGTNLDRAERLIRLAVAAEPDNQAFLDSLGWVLYKQGKFAEAARWFQQAITPPEMPDPEILDHFGDDLYRMGRADDAATQWQRSLEQLRIRPIEEQTELRLQVQRKLQDARLGQPVNVAPVVSGNAGPAAHRDQ
jgi:Tfp pilus assembly protein PilF